MTERHSMTIDERYRAMLDALSPEEAVIRTCELSDRVRTIAMAALRQENPTADARQIRLLLLERMGLWTRPAG